MGYIGDTTIALIKEQGVPLTINSRANVSIDLDTGEATSGKSSTDIDQALVLPTLVSGENSPGHYDYETLIVVTQTEVTVDLNDTITYNDEEWKIVKILKVPDNIRQFFIERVQP